MEDIEGPMFARETKAVPLREPFFLAPRDVLEESFCSFPIQCSYSGLSRPHLSRFRVAFGIYSSISNSGWECD